MKKKNLFWGILLIIAAVFLVVNKLGYFHDVNAFNLVITLFLAGIIIKSITRMEFGGILFPIAFICILYDDELGITSITPGTVLLAALLGTIGLSMIFHKHYHYHHKGFENFKIDEIVSEDEGHIKVNTSFSETIKYIKSESFEQADVDASFGSVKLYFDNATLKDGKGTVLLDLSFAGTEIYVPKTWTVDVKTRCSFGGVSEKNRNEKTPDNVLTLVGEISFAGVTIIYI